VSDPGSPSRQARQSRLLAVAGVLLVSGAVGFISYRLFVRPVSATSHAASSAPARIPPVADTPVPGEAPASSPPKVPERLPEIELPGADGKAHRLTDWKGRTLVVNFWATWCDPCRREIPLLKALRREHAGDGLEIVGIALDYPDIVRKYASDHGIDYPVLLGDREGLKASTAFGMETVLPFSVFADREGRVVTLKVGELHRDEAELILERIRAVEAGRLPLAAAQAEISAGVRHLREARAGQD
jgi:thiol-disulfide isomerase/thioredoxin